MKSKHVELDGQKYVVRAERQRNGRYVLAAFDVPGDPPNWRRWDRIETIDGKEYGLVWGRCQPEGLSSAENEAFWLQSALVAHRVIEAAFPEEYARGTRTCQHNGNYNGYVLVAPNERGTSLRAVIAVPSTGHAGMVLWFDGPLEYDIDCLGNNIAELGFLDVEEPGVWIWEGAYIPAHPDHEGVCDGDPTLSGTYRTPTDEEWRAIMAARSPWSDA